MDNSHKNLRAKEIFSKWENMQNGIAPLNTKDRDTIIELSSVAQAFPISRKYLNKKIVKSSNEDIVNLGNKNPIDGSKLPLSKINSSQKFLEWYADVERKMEREQDEPIHDYVCQLKSHKKECSNLLSQLDDALSNLKLLSDQYTSVSTRTSTLHRDCEHLLSEQTRLSSVADVVENKLAYFLEMNNISQKLRSPAFQVTSNEFIPLLAKVDQCINYMSVNLNFYEAQTYQAKYRQYLGRALGMVKIYVTKSLERSKAEVFKSASDKLAADNALLIYYGKFRNNAPRIKILMAEIEDRVNYNNEYANLLSDCHQCYFQQRRQIMEPSTTEAINELRSKYLKDYCSFVRSSCSFLVHVCEDEYTLFYQFFSAPSAELDVFLENICSILYDVVRPLIIRIDYLETLSEMCSILKRGMIEEQLQNNPTQLVSLTNIVNIMLEDCLERLVYRAHIYISSDIANYNPSQGDLAYPSKLEMMESISESLAKQKECSSETLSKSTSNESNNIVNLHTPADHFSSFGNSPADLHGMWYPTVRRTLVCLSKVYRCVDKSIFQGVCLEALSACMESLSQASSSINKTSTPVDGHLFEIKHLLILREQLSPFQVDHNLRSLTLDWSNLREAAMGLLQKRGRLFSLTSNNSLLEFIAEGTPQVTEHVLDSKRDIDNKLKQVCENFIWICCEAMISPISSFKAKTEAITNVNSERSAIIQLKTQPFAAPAKIAEVVTLSQRNIRSQVPLIQRSLQLYLSNKETEFIIFKPVRNSVINSFGWLKSNIVTQYDQEDQIIIGCPTQEEVSAQISLLCS